MYSNSSCLTVSNALLKSTKQVNRRFVPFWVYLQGSTLTVVRLPGASEMRLQASENGTQLVHQASENDSVICSIPEEQND